MDNQLHRVATFAKWNGDPEIHQIALAEHGFYFTGKGDEVECFSCHVRLSSWKAGMSPLERHLYASPCCEFIQSNSRVQQIESHPVETEDSVDGRSNNIDQLNIPHFTSQMLTVEPLQRNIARRSPPLLIKSNDDVLHVISQNNNDCQWYQPRPRPLPNILTTNEAVDYHIESNRLESFRIRWDTDNPMNPVDLAKAGFYFTGPGDRVQCVYCRGGLYNWDEGDTALGEHVKHFPLCTFAQDALKTLLSPQYTVPQQQDKNIKKKVTANQYEQSQNMNHDEWHHLPAVQIAKNMGYNSDVIKEAVEKVFSVSSGDLSSSKLLDAIFEIESNNTSPERSDTGCRTFRNESRENSLCEEGAVGWDSQVEYNETKQQPQEPITKSSPINEESLENYTETNDEELKRLMEENVRLRGNTQCKICLDSDVDTLFLPCRHLVCCEECSNAVQTCPCCRANIVGTVKTFLS